MVKIKKKVKDITILKPQILVQTVLYKIQKHNILKWGTACNICGILHSFSWYKNPNHKEKRNKNLKYNSTSNLYCRIANKEHHQTQNNIALFSNFSAEHTFLPNKKHALLLFVSPLYRRTTISSNCISAQFTFPCIYHTTNAFPVATRLSSRYSSRAHISPILVLLISL